MMGNGNHAENNYEVVHYGNIESVSENKKTGWVEVTLQGESGPWCMDKSLWDEFGHITRHLHDLNGLNAKDPIRIGLIKNIEHSKDDQQFCNFFEVLENRIPFDD